MKILIPTKLDKAAAATLMAAGYDVVQDDTTPIEELVADRKSTRLNSSHA